jgi:hypothetical protein
MNTRKYSKVLRTISRRILRAAATSDACTLAGSLTKNLSDERVYSRNFAIAQHVTIYIVQQVLGLTNITATIEYMERHLRSNAYTATNSQKLPSLGVTLSESMICAGISREPIR